MDIIKNDRYKIEKRDTLITYHIYSDINQNNELISISNKENGFSKPIITLSPNNRNNIISVDFKYLYELIDSLQYFDIDKDLLLNEVASEALSFLQNRYDKFNYIVGAINSEESEKISNFIKHAAQIYIYHNNIAEYQHKIMELENSLYFIDIQHNESNLIFNTFINNSCNLHIVKISNILLDQFNRFVNTLNLKYRKYITNSNLINVVNEFMSCTGIQARYINHYYGNVFLEDNKKEMELWKTIKIQKVNGY